MINGNAVNAYNTHTSRVPCILVKKLS